jgi:protein CpxP
MTSFFKPLLMVSLLAAAGASVHAQGMGMGGPQSGPMGQHQRMDPAKMQEMMAKRQADLKAKLNLTSTQEGAWTAYTAAIQPPAGKPMSQESRKAMQDGMAKLSTPERIEHMNAMKAQRDAEMAKRNEATKTFYAALTPEQQKVFDANAMGHGRRHGGPGKYAPQKS